MKIRCLLTLPIALFAAQGAPAAQSSDARLPAAVTLPSSKEILGETPGTPQQLNSLPMGIAWSPDHRYLAVVNAGFGTVESNYEQSVAILDTQTGDTQTGAISDNPDPRFPISAPQTLYNGIAFSSDGTHIFVSSDSITAPNTVDASHTGNGILVYKFNAGRMTPERIISIPLQKLQDGREQNPLGGLNARHSPGAIRRRHRPAAGLNQSTGQVQASTLAGFTI